MEPTPARRSWRVPAPQAGAAILTPSEALRRLLASSKVWSSLSPAWYPLQGGDPSQALTAFPPSWTVTAAWGESPNRATKRGHPDLGHTGGLGDVAGGVDPGMWSRSRLEHRGDFPGAQRRGGRSSGLGQ